MFSTKYQNLPSKNFLNQISTLKINHTWKTTQLPNQHLTIFPSITEIKMFMKKYNVIRLVSSCVSQWLMHLSCYIFRTCYRAIFYDECSIVWRIINTLKVTIYISLSNVLDHYKVLREDKRENRVKKREKLKVKQENYKKNKWRNDRNDKRLSERTLTSKKLTKLNIIYQALSNWKDPWPELHSAYWPLVMSHHLCHNSYLKGSSCGFCLNAYARDCVAKCDILSFSWLS